MLCVVCEDRPLEIDQPQIVRAFDHDSGLFDLSGEADDLGVAAFSEDDDLSADGFHGFVGLHDAALEAGYDRACGVDHANAQFPGAGIGRGGLTVGADQEASARDIGHFGMGDGL